MTNLENLENFDFNQFPAVWVGWAVNTISGRRKLVKVWANPPSLSNYRGKEVMNLGSLIVYEPGSWRNTTATPGCPVLNTQADYEGWYLVVVQSSNV